jgi:hypothetical protein
LDKKKIKLKQIALRKYELYLENFRQNANDGDSYGDINEILGRFETLNGAN